MLTAQTIQALNNSPLVTVAEFVSVTIVVMTMYFGIHKMFKRLRPATKMLISMFFGTVAYTFGKVAVFTLIIKPIIY